ncbi:MAG: acyltransferase [Bacteroidales bacterium]|jgi:peptidoglycan/LPS O-acetylase OafA/YrhL|nr:acyltransferase [Bacteroidales bacterium]
MNATQEGVTKSKFRDERLDTFRGFAMIWVVFNHCLFWMGFFHGSIFKTYLLIGTQLFFVIAGASNGMASKKPLLKFYLIRFKRILFPYWFYAALCLIITFLVSSPSTDISEAIANWFLYFNPWPCKPNILMWALWFVPVYLLVMAIFPFLRSYYEHFLTSLLRFAPFVIFATLLVLLQCKIIPFSGNMMHFSKQLVSYGFFTYLGLFFTSFMQLKKYQIRNAILIVLSCAAIVVVSILFFDVSPSMQKNKFPSTFIFLAFSVGLLCILYIFSNYIIRAVNFCKRNSVFAWMYAQYTKHGLTIFLFHPLVFLLLIKIPRSIFEGYNEWLVFTIITILAITLSSCVGYLFAWVEKLAQISLRKK